MCPAVGRSPRNYKILNLTKLLFEIKATSFKKVGALVDEFRDKGIITVGIDENGHPQVEDIDLPDEES